MRFLGGENLTAFLLWKKRLTVILLLITTIYFFGGFVYAGEKRMSLDELVKKSISSKPSPEVNENSQTDESSSWFHRFPIKAELESEREETVKPHNAEAIESGEGQAEKKALEGTERTEGIEGTEEGEKTEGFLTVPDTGLKESLREGGEWPSRQEDVGYTPASPINIPLTIWSLLLVSLLAYIVLKVYGKHISGGMGLKFGTKKRLINILDKHSITPNKQICIVEVPGKIILVGITENEIKLLCELEHDLVHEKQDVKESAQQEPASESSGYLADVLAKKWQEGK